MRLIGIGLSVAVLVIAIVSAAYRLHVLEPEPRILCSMSAGWLADNPGRTLGPQPGLDCELPSTAAP
jgi:hypothetical protein